jgi:hypothetical protein
MLLGALCDGCRQPVSGQVTNLQLVAGEIVQSTAGMRLRGTRPPESYNLCDSCVAPVYGLVHSMVRGAAVQR